MRLLLSGLFHQHVQGNEDKQQDHPLLLSQHDLLSSSRVIKENLSCVKNLFILTYQKITSNSHGFCFEFNKKNNNTTQQPKLENVFLFHLKPEEKGGVKRKKYINDHSKIVFCGVYIISLFVSGQILLAVA